MSPLMKKIACLCALWGGFGGGLNGVAAETGMAVLAGPNDGLTLDFGPIRIETAALEDDVPMPVAQRAVADRPVAEGAAADGPATDGAATDGSFSIATRVSGDVLASMRGAYDSASGVRISFGIERAVYIDGALVTSTSLNIADAGRMTGEQADMLGAAGDAVQVVQSGTGNVASLGTAAPFAAATVIQNTLNNRHISITTTIDAATDGLRLLKDLNLGMALRDALSVPVKRQ